MNGNQWMSVCHFGNYLSAAGIAGGWSCDDSRQDWLLPPMG